MNVNMFWRSLAAGLCGSVAHSCLMFLKSWAGWLPSFQPYEDLQHLLAGFTGYSVHPWIPWTLSFLNGAVVFGFLFGRFYRFLPGRNGAVKGLIFGALGWIMMGLLFFPALGLGLFAVGQGLGAQPAMFSFLMLVTYGIAMGVAYATLGAKDPREIS